MKTPQNFIDDPEIISSSADYVPDGETNIIEPFTIDERLINSKETLADELYEEDDEKSYEESMDEE